MIAGSLEIELSANLARLSADMQQAQKTVGGAMSAIDRSVAMAKGALIGLGVVGLAGAFANQVKQAIDLADSLNKLSQRTGISTESLSQWQYAAKLADVSTESLNTGIKKLNVSIAQGLAGDKEKVGLFNALGVSLTDASGKAKNADQVMLDIADSFSKAKDGAGKTAVAVNLLGKAGDEMIPLLNGGSQAIRDLKAEADKMGITISTDFAKRAEEFNDNLTKIKTSSSRVAIAMGDELVGGLAKAVKAMADATIESSKLAGVIAFIQTLATGDDQHKNNVQLVQDTESLLVAENMLAAARASNMDPRGVAARQKVVDDLKARIKTTMTYRRALEAQADAEEKAKKAAEDSRTNGNDIKVPGGKKDTSGAAYIAQLEKELGGLSNTTNKYDDVLAHLLLNEDKFTLQQGYAALALAERIDAQKDATAAVENRARAMSAELDAEERLTDAHYQAVESLQKMAEAETFELKLLNLTPDVIERARFERELDNRVRAANAALVSRGLQLGWDEVKMEEERAKIQREASDARNTFGLRQADMLDKQRNAQRGVTEALKDYNQELDDKGRAAYSATERSIRGIEDALVDMATTGKFSARSLVDSIISEVVRLQVVRPMMKQLFGTDANGGSGMGGGLLQGLFGVGWGGAQAAFSQTSLGSSGFGTGLAYGNQDFGGFLAEGGTARAGMAHIVGERGPELFIPGQTGTVVPNDAMGGSGYVDNRVYNIRVDARADQGAVAAGVGRAIRNNNKTLVEEVRR